MGRRTRLHHTIRVYLSENRCGPVLQLLFQTSVASPPLGESNARLLTMGNGVSLRKIPLTEEEALREGYTREEIDQYLFPLVSGA